MQSLSAVHHARRDSQTSMRMGSGIHLRHQTMYQRNKRKEKDLTGNRYGIALMASHVSPGGHVTLIDKQVLGHDSPITTPRVAAHSVTGI